MKLLLPITFRYIYSNKRVAVSDGSFTLNNLFGKAWKVDHKPIQCMWARLWKFRMLAGAQNFFDSAQRLLTDYCMTNGTIIFAPMRSYEYKTNGDAMMATWGTPNGCWSDFHPDIPLTHCCVHSLPDHSIPFHLFILLKRRWWAAPLPAGAVGPRIQPAAFQGLPCPPSDILKMGTRARTMVLIRLIVLIRWGSLSHASASFYNVKWDSTYYFTHFCWV